MEIVVNLKSIAPFSWKKLKTWENQFRKGNESNKESAWQLIIRLGCQNGCHKECNLFGILLLLSHANFSNFAPGFWEHYFSILYKLV